MNKIELLAPAGNMECLKAAVLSGADAVYLAGKLFGARSYADNFSDEELKIAVDYCHLRGVKVYVTVNTLISDREMSGAMDYLKMLNDIGVDAVIVQDLGLFSLVKENFPELPVHASTQMTAHNISGVKALSKMGAEQVVLSRELSLEEIKKIKNETDVKLEVFAHGALCMCYSGQCLLSSVLGGRSGNRGKCAQPCRLEYKINDNNDKGFYLSLKDLCALNHINEMKEIGVSSLKIEGRMKGAEYVSLVVGIYRKYIDSGEMPTKEDLERLDRIFYRGGQTDGYLTGRKGKEMFCFNKPDNPYEKQENDKYETPNREKKIKLSAKAKLIEGETPSLTIKGEGVEVTVSLEDVLEKGESKVVTKELFCEKINKTGGTPFEFENIEVEIKGAPFMAVGQINELRRCALSKFEEEYLSLFRRKGDYAIKEIKEKEKEEATFSCRVANINQFYSAKDYEFERFYVLDSVLLKYTEEFAPYKDKIVIETESIIKDEKETRKRLKILKGLGFNKLLVNNLAFLDEDDFIKYGGFRLNVFNSFALDLLKEKAFKGVTLSPELNLGAIRDMKKGLSVETMVYGHLPLMITENCIVRNNNNCPCNRDINYLTDRKGIKFPVVKDGENCRSVVLNSLPLYMGDKLDDIAKSGAESLLIYFTVEDEKRVDGVCASFFDRKDFKGEYTRLHYNKGVL